MNTHRFVSLLLILITILTFALPVRNGALALATPIDILSDRHAPVIASAYDSDELPQKAREITQASHLTSAPSRPEDLPITLRSGETTTLTSQREAQINLKPRSEEARELALRSTPLSLQPLPERPYANAATPPSLQQTTWQTILSEDFEIITDTWVLTYSTSSNVDAIEAWWGSTDVNADNENNPESIRSVWPALAGPSAVSAPDAYPDDLDALMVSGPIDVSSQTALEIYFSLSYDIGPLDWLGVCATTGLTAPDAFNWDEDCVWLGDSVRSDGWETFVIDLSAYAGARDLYLGLNFYSTSTQVEADYLGVFLDELELWGTAETYDPIDPYNELPDWNKLLDEQFTTLDPGNDPLWKRVSTPSDKVWAPLAYGENDRGMAAATDGYSNGTRSWLFYGPLDMSNLSSADVDFLMFYDLIYSDDANAANDDWLAFCATAVDKSITDISADDFLFDNCDWWTGSTEGEWNYSYKDLSSYAGRQQVYLGWYFEANNSSTAGGATIDWITVTGLPGTAEPPVVPTYDTNGIKLANGNFSEGLTSWQQSGTGSVTVVTNTLAWDPNRTTAAFSGTVSLFQDLEIPVGSTGVNIAFEYAVVSKETTPSTDVFCASLNDITTNAIKGDLGCWDVTTMPEDSRDGSLQEQVNRDLSAAQVSASEGQVRLVIDLKQDNQRPTTLLMTNMVVYAMGEVGRSSNPEVLALIQGTNDAIDQRSQDDTVELTGRRRRRDIAGQRDQNEVNDTPAMATPLKCGQTTRGLFGDVTSSDTVDVDWYRITRVATGTVTIDINAQTLSPPSVADTVATLWNDAVTQQLARNDDESPGTLTDSKIIIQNPADEGVFLLQLQNVTSINSTEAFYELKVECTSADTTPPQTSGAPLTTPSSSAANVKDWTMILMLNGEDQACKQGDPSREDCWDRTYEKSIKGIEEFMAQKSSFMNVVVLLDGPNFDSEESDTRRYIVGAGSSEITNLSEQNLGDGETLRTFVDWAMTNYPARHYYVSVDDHGGGVQGTSLDHTGTSGPSGGDISDSLTAPELYSALKQVTRGGQRKIDVFAFESCLMGFFENAYDIREFVNYTVFFQSISWTSVNYPEYFRTMEATTSGEELAKHMIDVYPVTSDPWVFSAVQSSALENVRLQLDAFATALMASDADLSKIRAARDATQSFKGSEGRGAAGPTKDQLGFLDLWDFAEQVRVRGIASSEALALQQAIEQAVINKRAVATGTMDDKPADYSNYHGFSIFFPAGGYTLITDYCRVYQLSANGTGSWARFLSTKVYADYPLNCSGTGVDSNIPTSERLLQVANVLDERPMTEPVLIYLPMIRQQ